MISRALSTRLNGTFGDSWRRRFTAPLASLALIAGGSPTGPDIAMEAGALRIEVEKAKVNWGTYLQDMFRPRFGGGFQNYSGRGPSVVAHNFNGEKRVLELTKTVEDAQNRATAIKQDFSTLETAQWCERYNVPLAFVSG
jgi:hypothetical protein